MSKLFLLIFSLFIVIFLIILNPTSVYALEKCLMSTDPSPLTNEAPKAKFIVSVASLGGVSAFNNWKIEFKCGAPNKKCGPNESCSVVKDGPDKIYTEVNNGPAECVFSAGGHTLIVKGVRSDGTEVDQCEATYGIRDVKSICKLSINPETGITSNTNLTVSGENLPSGGRFAVFVDNQRIKNFPNPFVDTPDFSGLQIPPNFLTPGTHKIDLREFEVTVNPTNPAGPIDSNYSQPLCPLGFRVGTEANPGSVSGSGPAGIINWIPGISSFNKDLQCGSDQDPAIATAIGCIHTSPASFVKDAMKFVIAISGGLAFLMMLLGAFQMLTSAGNPETLAAGKDRLQNAIIGLLIIIFATLLLRIIGLDILGIPGFGLTK